MDATSSPIGATARRGAVALALTGLLDLAVAAPAGAAPVACDAVGLTGTDCSPERAIVDPAPGRAQIHRMPSVPAARDGVGSPKEPGSRPSAGGRTGQERVPCRDPAPPAAKERMLGVRGDGLRGGRTAL